MLCSSCTPFKLKMGPFVKNCMSCSIRISLEKNVASPPPWKLLFQEVDCSVHTIYYFGGKKTFKGNNFFTIGKWA